MRDFDNRPDGTPRRRGEGGYRACIKAGPFTDDIVPLGTAGDMLPNHRPYDAGAPKALVIDKGHVFVGEVGSLHLRLGEEFPYARDTADRGIGYTFGFVAPLGTKIPTIEEFQSLDTELRKELARLVTEANEGRASLQSDLSRKISALAESGVPFDSQHEWNRVVTTSELPQRAFALDFKGMGESEEMLVREAVADVFVPDAEASILNSKKKALPQGIAFKGITSTASSALKIGLGGLMACGVGWTIYETLRRKETRKTERSDSALYTR
jgi:hypothetical protein